jgi:K+-transporting ATPase ATPase B chain
MNATHTNELKHARRKSRRQGLFAGDVMKVALRRAFVMLRPDML